MAESKATESRMNGLDTFLKEAELYVESILNGIASVTGEHEDAPLISSHSGALRLQFANLTNYAREKNEKAANDAKHEVEELMRIQAVSTLVANGRDTFIKTAAKGLFGGGIFAWIESHFEEIKKIIREILALLGAPSWLDTIIQIIDQILKLILGLLAGIFGKNSAKVMAELSSMEVEFWNEVGAREKIKLARINFAKGQND